MVYYSIQKLRNIMALQQLVHVHVKDKVGYYGNLEWQLIYSCTLTWVVSLPYGSS